LLVHGGFDLELAVEIMLGRIDGNTPADFAVEWDMIGARHYTTLTTIFPFTKEETLASSTEGGDPLRLGDAPHAFTGAVVFDAQVHGFGVVTQQCSGGLEFFEAFDAGEECNRGERDQVGEIVSVESARLAAHVDFHRSSRGTEHFGNRAAALRG